jgi:aminopeptidase
MFDPRFNDLAEVLVGYSTKLKKGERVLIDAFDVPQRACSGRISVR